ncbi:hypothetical protein LWI28_007200 [Acer negundo]|uniref:Uncharacterized protein n=1 Tax=Acer negundo TaxID=4023 RepID=A0AAD5IDI4_ACENE|nr:hypothetical protein LWI28_007200 [Acer negundo]
MKAETEQSDKALEIMKNKELANVESLESMNKPRGKSATCKEEEEEEDRILIRLNIWNLFVVLLFTE